MNKTEAVKKICDMEFVENRDDIVVAKFSQLFCEVCREETKTLYVNLLGMGEKIDACPACQVKINRIEKWLESSAGRALEI